MDSKDTSTAAANNGYTAASRPAATCMAVPFKWSRFTLFVAAALLALGALVAQVVLMTHNLKLSDDYDDYIFELHGKDYAKAPGLVVAAAAISLLCTVLLGVAVFFQSVSASLWGAIVHVVVPSVVLAMWVGALGTSAKTADVLSPSYFPKVWKHSNSAALACVCISILLWIAVLVLSIVALVRVIRAWQARKAPAGNRERRSAQGSFVDAA